MFGLVRYHFKSVLLARKYDDCKAKEREPVDLSCSWSTSSAHQLLASCGVADGIPVVYWCCCCSLYVKLKAMKHTRSKSARKTCLALGTQCLSVRNSLLIQVPKPTMNAEFWQRNSPKLLAVIAELEDIG